MSRASEAGVLGERCDLNVKNEENISVISKNITQFDMKNTMSVDAASTLC